MNQLADLIRQNLAISSDVQKELKASSFQPTSKSPAALSAYMQGLQLRRQGKNLDALKSFQASVAADPEFALAYSRLAETNSALGYDSQAEQASRKALELDSQLPLAEKYLIEANHARVMKDNKKAIETYEKLAASMPGDNDVQFTLGNLYLDTSEFDKARAQFAKVLKNDPKNLMALLQTGWLEVQNGKPQAGLDPLNRALSLAIEVDNEEQKAQVLQIIGIAYDGMNKYDEALRNVQESLEISKRLGNKSAAANSYSEIGDIQSLPGEAGTFAGGLQRGAEVAARHWREEGRREHADQYRQPSGRSRGLRQGAGIVQRVVADGTRCRRRGAAGRLPEQHWECLPCEGAKRRRPDVLPASAAIARETEQFGRYRRHAAQPR